MRPKTQVDAPTVMVSPKTKAAEAPARPASKYTDKQVQWPRTISTSGATVYRAYVLSARWLKLSCRNDDDTSLHAWTEQGSAVGCTLSHHWASMHNFVRSYSDGLSGRDSLYLPRLANL